MKSTITHTIYTFGLYNLIVLLGCDANHPVSNELSETLYGSQIDDNIMQGDPTNVTDGPKEPHFTAGLESSVFLETTPFTVALSSSEETELSQGDVTFVSVPEGTVEYVEKLSVRLNEMAFSCKKSGDFAIVFSTNGKSSPVSGTCKLVSTIQTPKTVEYIIGIEPKDIEVVARDENGQKLDLDSTDFEVVIADSSVVEQVNDEDGHLALNQFNLKKIGQTSVTYKIGAIETTSSVVVGKKIKSESLSIADGEVKAITLQTGNYIVEVQAHDVDRNGTSIGWVGTECSQRAENVKHVQQCEIYNTATLQVTNPSLLGLGYPVTGFLNVYEMPKSYKRL